MLGRTHEISFNIANALLVSKIKKVFIQESYASFNISISSVQTIFPVVIAGCFISVPKYFLLAPPMFQGNLKES